MTSKFWSWTSLILLLCAVFGSIEDQGEVFVTVEDEGAFADNPNKQGDHLPGLEMVEEDPLKLTPISRRFSEESGYQSKSEATVEYEWSLFCNNFDLVRFGSLLGDKEFIEI